MFGKLVKYEFKSIGKWYLVINVALLALSAVLGGINGRLYPINLNSVTSDISISTSGISDWQALLFGLLSLCLGLLIASSLIATLVIIIRRFYTNIFGREGYLTLTLPVSTHQIILSKWLSAICLQLINGLVLVIALVLLFLPTIGLSNMLAVLPQASNIFSYQETYAVLISLLVSIVSSSISFYMAMAIGQLFQNNRILMAFLAYIAISIISGFIGTFISSIFSLEDAFSMPYVIFSIIYSLVWSVISYIITHFIITHRLNIQ
ncbi:ABC transporter permease [Streptococcus sp. zg-JUN1979]|uniref:ABC transporter permease n=1 Tax=Streptococcus sp. zg-JUN1979 TaxID=3391450 RepID=UPI0039A72DCD